MNDKLEAVWKKMVVASYGHYLDIPTVVPITIDNIYFSSPRQQLHLLENSVVLAGM
jgi:hypothetical protein